MSFATIRPIERADALIDVAFRKGKNRVANFKVQSKEYVLKQRELERVRMAAMCADLIKRFDAILCDFPRLDELSLFYHELVLCTLDYNQVKKSLGAMKWARGKIESFSREYQYKVSRCEAVSKMREYRQSLYGRIASVVKQVDKHLLCLEHARKIIVEFPVIKKMNTIALIGFPNVGKTTLLSKLTGSTPDIAVYSFTTKGLNIGYLTHGKKKVQIIDTPGTLNRLDKMNAIEKQAYLAIKHVADLIIYIFDPTEEYSMHDQIALYTAIKGFEKPMLVFASKTDLVSDESVECLVQRFNAVTNIELLIRLVKKRF